MKMVAKSKRFTAFHTLYLLYRPAKQIEWVEKRLTPVCLVRRR